MWDERYREAGYAYGVEPNDFLCSSAEFLPPGGRVLSLGEGEGRNAVFLAQRGHSVVAVDSSAVGLAKAAALARARNVVVETAEADLAAYTIAPMGYDGIISIFCHLPPEVRARLYAQVNRGLQSGGIFILEGFAGRQSGYRSGGPKNPALLLELEQVVDELRPLEIKYAVETVREVREGNYHTGEAAVIQVIGVKQ